MLKKRGGWLAVLFVGELFTASAITILTTVGIVGVLVFETIAPSPLM